LLALADIHRENLVRQPHLLQRDADLAAVRRIPGVEFDGHLCDSSKADITYPGTRRPYNLSTGRVRASHGWDDEEQAASAVDGAIPLWNLCPSADRLRHLRPPRKNLVQI